MTHTRRNSLIWSTHYDISQISKIFSHQTCNVLSMVSSSWAFCLRQPSITSFWRVFVIPLARGLFHLVVIYGFSNEINSTPHLENGSPSRVGSLCWDCFVFRCTLHLAKNNFQDVGELFDGFSSWNFGNSKSRRFSRYELLVYLSMQSHNQYLKPLCIIRRENP